MNAGVLIRFISMSAFAVLTGCASITGTTGQNVSVEARTAAGQSVAGASCELTNSKGKWFVNTPGSVGIRRSNDDMAVICNKDGLEAGRAAVVSDIKGSMFGNIIFGGGVGAIVDHTSGAAYEYPTLIQVVMGAMSKIETPKSTSDGSASSPVAAMPPMTQASLVPAAQSTSSPSQKMNELNAMHKSGAISQKEFEEKKAEILKGL